TAHAVPIPQNPAPDIQTMEELCQLSMNGQGGPIAPVNIQAKDFGLKNHMIQQVQQSCQYHGLPGDDANKHIDKFLIVTQSMKQNGVSHDDTINADAGGTFTKRQPLECYSLIENMNTYHNDWDTSAQRGKSSRSTTSSSPEIEALTQQIAEKNKNFLRMSQPNQQVNVVNPSCEICSGLHHYSECQAAGGFTQGDVYAA
ncbi:hypothetical protein Tco_1566110, partial [Tanacetum coccineum]